MSGVEQGSATGRITKQGYSKLLTSMRLFRATKKPAPQ